MYTHYGGTRPADRSRARQKLVEQIGDTRPENDPLRLRGGKKTADRPSQPEGVFKGRETAAYIPLPEIGGKYGRFSGGGGGPVGMYHTADISRTAMIHALKTDIFAKL
jgi:hypothetical protein